MSRINGTQNIVFPYTLLTHYSMVCPYVCWSRGELFQNVQTHQDAVGGVEVRLGHAQTYPRSTFSTVFARRQQLCGSWLQVYCSNLFNKIANAVLLLRPEYGIKTDIYT